MDLWIRSQDRKYLGKINEVLYAKVEDKHTLYIHLAHMTFPLGVYESEERALEVLYEIQYQITLGYKIKIDVDDYDLTYEMPKE